MSAFNSILQALGAQHQQPPQMPPPMPGQGQLTEEEMQRMMQNHPAAQAGPPPQDQNFMASNAFNNMVGIGHQQPQNHSVVGTLLKLFGGR